MIEIGHRPQRSLARSVAVPGTGFITGSRVTLRFCPAVANTGIVFLRTDLRKPEPIPARADRVTGTQRRTTLGSGPNQVTLAEHVLAALAGMRIDNCIVELDGPEPPGLDGSCMAFVEAIVDGGIVLQMSMRTRWSVREAVVLKQGGATLSLFPATGDSLRFSYFLDYGPRSPIAPQTHSEKITSETFPREIAPCRTFLLEEEAVQLQRQGIGKHLKPTELLVFGAHGPIDNELRRPNEPARHKILDLVGDLALSGMDLAGHVVAYRSGHPLNVELAKTLCRMAERAAIPSPCRIAA